MFRKILFAAVLTLLCASGVSAASYINGVPQKDWTKYGVNPWSNDTDLDGFPDAWEITNKYCPTNPVLYTRLDDGECEKGKIDYKKGVYTPPKNIEDVFPSTVKKAADCSEIEKFFWENYDEYSSGNLTGLENYTVAKRVGDYSFVFNDNFLTVLKTTDKGVVEKVSQVKISNLTAIKEIQVSGNFLAVIGREKNHTGNFANMVQFWNIANKKKPVLLRQVSFNRGAVESYVSQGYLYLSLRGASDSSTDKYSLNYQDLLIKNSARKNLNKCSEIEYVSSLTQEKNYNLSTYSVWYLAALPMNGRGTIGSKVVIGKGESLFAGDSWYLFSGGNNQYGSLSKTEIYRYTLNGKNFKLANSTAVDNIVFFSDSATYYKNNLYVVARQYAGSVSNLYVLDKQLNKIGWYNNLPTTSTIANVIAKNDKLYLDYPALIGADQKMLVFDVANPRAPNYLGSRAKVPYTRNEYDWGGNYLLSLTNRSGSSQANNELGIGLSLVSKDTGLEPWEVSKINLGKNGTWYGQVATGNGYIAMKINLQNQSGSTGTNAGNYWQGVMVYKVSLDNGMELAGSTEELEYEVAGLQIVGDKLLVLEVKTTGEIKKWKIDIFNLSNMNFVDTINL